MKIRTDFVTNSSSSSFILAFKDKEDGMHQISNLMDQYDNAYIDVLLGDFTSTTPISPDTFADHVKEDVEDIACSKMSYGEGGWWSRSKPTFENLWRKSHPNADWADYYESPEYKEEQARLVGCIMGEINDRIAGKPYIVELEYGDHSSIGSELEHYILPNCDFTVRRFNHH